MEMKKIDNLLVKCKDKETGEEGYVEMGLIGEAIFKTLVEDGCIKPSKSKKGYGRSYGY